MGRGSSKASGPKTRGEAFAAATAAAEAKYGRPMDVPIDEWGPMLDGVDISTLDPEDPEDTRPIHFGTIEDETRYVMEPLYLPVTKKSILEEVDAWRNDDGTYGDEDTHIGIAYKDGSYVSLNDDLDGKPYKKSGIVGVHVSGADSESVWGGEVNPKTGVLTPYETWEPDGSKGHSNSTSTYKATGTYKVRMMRYVVDRGNGTTRPATKIIGRSTVRGINGGKDRKYGEE